MQTDGELSPSHIASGFTARFPDIAITPGDTFNIVLNEDYSEFYGQDFVPDLIMYGSDDNSMLETETEPYSSFGGADNKIGEISEMLILFYWDGDFSNLIQDVDYFLWGAYQTPINKTGISTYQDDTPIESQLFFETVAATYYAYLRIETEEIDETQTGGNGITGHDETSENFRESWEIIELFNLGCMDSEAPNYDPFAEFDDGSCLVSFEPIINGDFDCGYSSSNYCDNTTECPFLNIQGLIVDYFDITPFGGPHSIILEDPIGYQIELTIWPSEWDIVNDSLAFILSPPYNQILIQASGGIFDYNGNKLMRICSSDNILIVDIFGCTDPEATNYNPDATVDDGSCEYSNIELILSFDEVDLESQTIAIHLENSAPVSGFQFLLSSADSIDFVDVYGGSAEENGFAVELGGNNIVLGFSLSLTEIPTGSDVLTIVEFDGYSQAEICLSEAVIVSGYEDAQYFEVSYGDCISLYSKGDVNMDGVLDVLDIVTIVNIIFETIDPDDYQLWAADYNSDGDINIMDIVQIVNAIFADDVISEGCMDDGYQQWSPYPGFPACNYSPDATMDNGSCWYAEENYDCDGNCNVEIDCAGVCGGTAVEDNCAVCDNDTSNDCIQDCAGVWGGNAIIDNCEICVGGDTGLTACIQDCAGEWGGNVVIDECGVCDGDGSSCEPSLCDGLTEVELWGEYYDIGTTTEIDLSGSWLTGSIPLEIGCLTNLIILHLSSNQLTGEIPVEIGQLTNLAGLFLSNNQLTGEIPVEIWGMTNLTYLSLHGNQLTGEIPPEIGQLTNLEYLSLSSNQLTGEIPDEIGQLTSLTTLSLSSNQLTGEIPVPVCDLIESNNLDMDNILYENNLINTCEEEPSLCVGLTEVELWGEWYDIETTTEIDLWNSGLTGSIPPEIGCLTNLTLLYLHDNDLTGEIPSEIGNLTNLIYLYLSVNQLTGEIPSTIGDLLENLTQLIVDDNDLTGEITPEIGNLINLTRLDLSSNQLTGEIPPEVCDLIESNHWVSWWSIEEHILEGNNLINTCD